MAIAAWMGVPRYEDSAYVRSANYVLETLATYRTTTQKVDRTSPFCIPVGS
ncbi:MAG: hypothetical protein ACERKX_14945 [Anaerolineales bacterium]